MAKDIWVKYRKELNFWLKNGWWVLLHTEKDLGLTQAVIPLMAVVQTKKNKVQPVINYREFDVFVDAIIANADLCAQTLQEWWFECSNVAILYLKKAYLQVHIHKSPSLFQTMMLKRQRYYLT